MIFPYISIELLDIISKVSSILGGLAVITAAIKYLFTIKENRLQQRRQTHYQAWQALNMAHGTDGNAGRILALQQLNGDAVSLAGINLANAWLRRLKIPFADLREANLTNADLTGADLRGAILTDADLTDAILEACNLRYADFEGAKITWNKDLLGSVDWANLANTCLAGMSLSKLNFQGTCLKSADLSNVAVLNSTFYYVDLREANLSGLTLWKSANFKSTNIYGVIDPPEGFREHALQGGAVEIKSGSVWEKLVNTAAKKGGVKKIIDKRKFIKLTGSREIDKLSSTLEGTLMEIAKMGESTHDLLSKRLKQ